MTRSRNFTPFARNGKIFAELWPCLDRRRRDRLSPQRRHRGIDAAATITPFFACPLASPDPVNVGMVVSRSLRLRRRRAATTASAFGIRDDVASSSGSSCAAVQSSSDGEPRGRSARDGLEVCMPNRSQP